MAKEESPLAIPQEVESHPAWYRLNDQLNWYNKRSGTSQRWYKTIKTTQLFLASAIPVVSFLVEIPWVRLATAVLEAVMNVLTNGLLMRKTGGRRRTELTEIFAFLCGFPAEFITRSRSVAEKPP